MAILNVKVRLQAVDVWIVSLPPLVTASLLIVNGRKKTRLSWIRYYYINVTFVIFFLLLNGECPLNVKQFGDHNCSKVCSHQATVATTDVKLTSKMAVQPVCLSQHSSKRSAVTLFQQ